MDHLRRLGDGISVPIAADENGFIGRECPQQACEGYFKIVLGTGLEGEGLPCHCPYCGHTGPQEDFCTEDQIEYATSVASRQITDAVYKDLKRLEFDHKPAGDFGLGFSMKVRPGRLTPIYHYREKQLETEVVCSSCTLRYAVYGVFAFCPDCGEHNSLQILDENLKVVEKILDLAAGVEAAVAGNLIQNALEDCVSAFDGFARELCQVYSGKASRPVEAQRISFQNLDGAQVTLRKLFGIDLDAGISAAEWREVTASFQKRHLIAHKLGVVDQDYINKTGDRRAVVGRKVAIGASEVRRMVSLIRRLATSLSAELANL